MRLIWLRPTKPNNISVGRERIADALETRGHKIELHDASGFDAVRAVIQSLIGEYDAIIGTARMGIYIGFPVSVILRKPFLADVADPIQQIDDLPTLFYNALRRYEFVALDRADASTFTYKSSYREAKQRGIVGVKVQNGVDYNLFREPSLQSINKAQEVLRASGLSPDDQIAIYIGGLTESYHLFEIIEAAKRLSEWEFLFVGDGEQRGAVGEAAKELCNVHYPGSFEYRVIPGILKQADVGFCLVDAEQPLKMLEYGAAGLPVIAAKGELETRFSADEALFIDPTPRQIVESLQKLSDDCCMGANYGENLRRFAADCLWTDIADTYEQILTSIC